MRDVRGRSCYTWRRLSIECAGCGVRGPQGVLLGDRVVQKLLDDGSYIACAQAAIQRIALPCLYLLQSCDAQHASAGKHALGQRVRDSQVKEHVNDMGGRIT